MPERLAILQPYLLLIDDYVDELDCLRVLIVMYVYAHFVKCCTDVVHDHGSPRSAVDGTNNTSLR